LGCTKRYVDGYTGRLCIWIVGVASHDKNIHDSKTLTVAISHANSNRNKPIKQAVCDRGSKSTKLLFIQYRKKP
jgi:hypothetical protein